MANYTGDPTNTQAPSPDPRDDAYAIGDLPADTDPPNGSTFAQAFKAIYNALAFLRRPRAKVGAWAAAIQRWQNARLQDRFIVDHMGFPGGKIAGYLEYWRGQEISTSASHAWDKTVHRWTSVVTVTGGVGLNMNTSHGNLLMGIGTGPVDDIIMVGDDISPFTSSYGCAMECTVTNVDAAISEQKIAVGLSDESTSPFGTFVGAFFYKGNGDTNWMCRTGDGFALDTAQDSGVACVAGGEYRLRVEWLGSAVADNALDAVRFYINDVLVAQFEGTAHLPSNAAAAPPCQPTFALTRDTGSTARLWVVSPMRFSVNK